MNDGRAVVASCLLMRSARVEASDESSLFHSRSMDMVTSPLQVAGRKQCAIKSDERSARHMEGQNMYIVLLRCETSRDMINRSVAREPKYAIDYETEWSLLVSVYCIRHSGISRTGRASKQTRRKNIIQKTNYRN